MPANPTKDHDDGSSPIPQRRTLTRPEFDDVLSKMRSRSIKAVERTTVLVDGIIDGIPMVAALDLMTDIGYLQVCSPAADGNPPSPRIRS